jgi:hypothetical protein
MRKTSIRVTPISAKAKSKTTTKSTTSKSGRKSAGEKLSIAKKKLRHGDLTTISLITGYDASHVARVIRGERKNPCGRIANVAYELVGKRK